MSLHGLLTLFLSRAHARSLVLSLPHCCLSLSLSLSPALPLSHSLPLMHSIASAQWARTTAKKSQREMEEDKQEGSAISAWTCTRCTLENRSATADAVCAVCDSPRILKGDSAKSAVRSSAVFLRTRADASERALITARFKDDRDTQKRRQGKGISDSSSNGSSSISTEDLGDLARERRRRWFTCVA